MKTAEYAKFFRIDIHWSDEDDAWLAACPDLPGCITHGETEEEALEHAKEARESYLESLDDRGISKLKGVLNKKYSGKVPLRIDPSLHRELAIRAKLKDKSLNQLVEETLRKSAV